MRFSEGALGNGMPDKPLYLTGNHRVLCASRLVARMFGEPRVLMPAKRFVPLRAVDTDDESELSDYIHLELTAHSIVLANGALVESCLLGPMVAQGLPHLLRQVSSSREPAKTRYSVPAGKAQREFVRRLVKNSRKLVEPSEQADCFRSLDKCLSDVHRHTEPPFEEAFASSISRRTHAMIAGPGGKVPLPQHGSGQTGGCCWS